MWFFCLACFHKKTTQTRYGLLEQWRNRFACPLMQSHGTTYLRNILEDLRESLHLVYVGMTRAVSNCTAFFLQLIVVTFLPYSRRWFPSSVLC
jgi:ATP-dependent exoDNAse (exonuclease V) beta subunit